MTVVLALALVLAMTPTETLQAEVALRPDQPHFVEIDAGADHACGRTESGRVLCWGSSVWGQLGDGRIAATDDTPLFGPAAFDGPGDVVRGRPVEVETSRRFRAVASGGRHTCALTEAGQAYCWGMGRFGQLGTGSRSNAAVPVKVADDLRFRDISAGGTHTCAVASSGEGYCWGGNWHGQLGDGTLVSRSRPVRVALDGELTSISAGGVHTCAVTRSGEAFCWGDRRDGRLGTGQVEEVDRPRPVEVTGGITWRRLAAGGAHTCGLEEDSRLHCWGRAMEGQLGVDTATESLTEPEAVVLAPEVENVATGPRHTCALAGERTWCWGEGTGAYVRPPGGGDADVPAVVEDVPTAADIAAGGSAFGSFTCVLTGRDVRCLAGRRSVGISPPDTALAGSWEGEFEGPRAPIFLTLRLERVDEGWTGSLVALGETHSLEEVALTEDGVRAVLVPGPGGFSLEADLTDGHLRGWVTEGEARYPLELVRVPGYRDPDGRVAAWHQDLDALTERFLRFDRSFTPAERSLFSERIGELREELSELDDAEIRMRMAAAVALSDNAHTRLYLLRNRTELRRLPVRLWWFSDGAYVVRALSRHEELLGCRVDAIEGLPARFVRDSLAGAFAGNPSWVDYKSVYYMTSPGALHGFGLAQDPERVEFSFSSCGRGSFERHLEPLPLTRSRESVEAWWDLSPRHREAGWTQALEGSNVTLPLHLRHPGRHYWFEYLYESGILYVQYNRASEMEEDLDAFGERLLDELQDRDSGALVLDLRFNTGGSLGLARDLMEDLEARTKGIPRFVITGRATFSAGISHVASWKEAGDVRLVGEPVGDALDYWSEGGNILLPNSGLTAHFANAFHSYSETPCPEDVPCFLDLSAPPLLPDLPVSASWADYAAGIDVVLEAVLAAVRERGES